MRFPHPRVFGISMQPDHGWAVTTNCNAYGGSSDVDSLRFETRAEIHGIGASFSETLRRGKQ